MEPRSSPGRPSARVVCIVLDVTILALLGVVLLILVTGGGVVELGSIRVRARTVENPLWFLAAAIALRYATRAWSPFLGVSRWPIEAATTGGVYLVSQWIPAHLPRLFTRPVPGLAGVVFVVILVKVLLAWRLPGFYSGDDVEVHEMTLGVLLRKAWPVWDLRNAFFPMIFVYPAQRIALALGAVTPETFVLAGRAVVAVVSTAAIPLTWLAARRLAPADPRLAACAALLVALNKLHISFGSSELPRPVSTVFVVAAFLCVLQPRLLATAAAGALLGIAAAFRFSEVVFLPAALLTLGRERYLARAAVLLAAAALALAGITATADALYWGRPFASVAAAIDYTLVQRQSSRGFEPPWQYVRIIPAWTAWLFVALAVGGSSRRHPDSWWLWTPIALLSLLPHKESRYLIPVVPFLAIATARGFLRFAQWARASASTVGWRRWARELVAPLLLLSVLHEIGGWRLSRSNQGIRLAHYLRESGGAGIAAQELWRLGGRPYLWPQEPLVDVVPAQLTDIDTASGALAGMKWVALRSHTARTVGDPFMASLGFEVDGGWQGEDYVLYVRSAGSR